MNAVIARTGGLSAAAASELIASAITNRSKERVSSASRRDEVGMQGSL